MSRFEELKKANPQLEWHCVCEEAFKPYGRKIEIDMTDMINAVKENVKYPESGCSYVTAFDPMDKHANADHYRNILCGQLDEQWGLCWGYNNKMEALEWHTCNEFNVGVTDAVLLLAKRADIDENGMLDSKKVKAFYVPEGAVVEVYADSLHYAPCQVSKEPFAVVVGLQRGTNEALDQSIEYDEAVTAKNKWLYSHVDVEIAGAPKRITGENWEVKMI